MVSLRQALVAALAMAGLAACSAPTDSSSAPADIAGSYSSRNYYGSDDAIGKMLHDAGDYSSGHAFLLLDGEIFCPFVLEKKECRATKFESDNLIPVKIPDFRPRNGFERELAEFYLEHRGYYRASRYRHSYVPNENHWAAFKRQLKKLDRVHRRKPHHQHEPRTSCGGGVVPASLAAAPLPQIPPPPKPPVPRPVAPKPPVPKPVAAKPPASKPTGNKPGPGSKTSGNKTPGNKPAAGKTAPKPKLKSKVNQPSGRSRVFGKNRTGGTYDRGHRPHC